MSIPDAVDISVSYAAIDSKVTFTRA